MSLAAASPAATLSAVTHPSQKLGRRPKEFFLSRSSCYMRPRPQARTEAGMCGSWPRCRHLRRTASGLSPCVCMGCRQLEEEPAVGLGFVHLVHRMSKSRLENGELGGSQAPTSPLGARGARRRAPQICFPAGVVTHAARSNCCSQVRGGSAEGSPQAGPRPRLPPRRRLHASCGWPAAPRSPAPGAQR